jgi:hypothetical protein
MAPRKKKSPDEPEKPKGPSPFDYVKSVISDSQFKLGTPELPSSGLNRFMLIRGVSSYPDLILEAAAANKLTRTPDPQVFEFLHRMIPKKFRKFQRFPKQAKADPELMTKANAFCKKHCVSMKTAISYIQGDHLDVNL